MSHSAAPPDPATPPDLVRLLAEAGLMAPANPDGAEASARTLHETLAAMAPAEALPHYLQAIELLLQWQRASRPGVLPPMDPTQQRAALDRFTQAYLQGYRGLAIAADQLQRLHRVYDVLLQHNRSWPSVFVHGNFSPRALRVAPAWQVLDVQGAHEGPVPSDIASLVRDSQRPWEEDFVLDLTVRYWQKARAAELPVGDDFGAFYRGVEWAALERDLGQLGLLALASQSGAGHGGEAAPAPSIDRARSIDQVRATAARYIELKPLLRLVDAAEGVQDAATFVFGRG